VYGCTHSEHRHETDVSGQLDALPPGERVVLRVRLDVLEKRKFLAADT
jgi:hypothetical protein